MIVLSKLLPVAVYPLGLVIELIVLGLFFIHRKKVRLAYGCLGFSLFILLAFSNQYVAGMLFRKLERRYPTVNEQTVKADAIVVLGGCCRPNISPRNHVEFNEGAERIFEGIRLFKAGAAPVVIPTGGGIDFILKGQKEGNDMREALVEFGVPEGAVLAETQSRNTHENAVLVKKLMREKNIPLHIILVTSAAHMRRSVTIFTKAGFDVIPAPADFLVEDRSGDTWFNLLPKVECLTMSTQAIKEWIGIMVYKLMGWL